MQKLTLTWKGEKATLGEDEAFIAADAVEDHITFGELAQMRVRRDKIRFAKLALAYSTLLRSAGFNVTPRDVHREFTDALKGKTGEDRIKVAIEAIDWLIMVLMDGAPEAEGETEGDSQGNEQAPAS